MWGGVPRAWYTGCLEACLVILLLETATAVSHLRYELQLLEADWLLVVLPAVVLTRLQPLHLQQPLAKHLSSGQACFLVVSL